jgi:hypothetical protein
MRTCISADAGVSDPHTQLHLPMKRSIILEVSHPERPHGRIQGFRFMWAYYVRGYKPDLHCQPCFRGERVADFSTSTASTDRQVTLDRMDRYPYVYLCGVGSGPKTELYLKNFHLPLEFSENDVVERQTYNGYRFRATNARELPISPLPADWNGLSREHTSCKNFQFAVQYFGYQSPPP